MRILYDGYIYDWQQFGGVNRYFNEIIRRLPPGDEPFISTLLGRRDFWPVNPRLRVLRSRPFARAPALAPLGAAWLRGRIRLVRPQLLHPTYYLGISPGLLESPLPLVATVHDMIHELFPAELDPRGELVAAKRRLVERADLILCNSEHTRCDFLAAFPALEARVRVTPLAASLVPDPAAEAATPAFDHPCFLYVGGRETYKNFSTLLAAWKQFSPRHPDHRLRVVGSPWVPAESAAIAAAGLAGSILHEGKATDSRLSVLYRRSLALVYPSRYEGFGLPVLEAMRCGTAVICSRSSSLPEVGGNAPLYFDPASAEELCQRMEQIAESPSLRALCVERGHARAPLFTWDHTAALTRAAYAELCP
jgi:glycosyltransferase involved in cell wall biosynthesis